MHKPESVLENEIHNILWDLDIQIDRQIPHRRSDLELNIKKKKNLSIRNFLFQRQLK